MNYINPNIYTWLIFFMISINDYSLFYSIITFIVIVAFLPYFIYFKKKDRITIIRFSSSLLFSSLPPFHFHYIHTYIHTYKHTYIHAYMHTDTWYQRVVSESCTHTYTTTPNYNQPRFKLIHILVLKLSIHTECLGDV